MIIENIHQDLILNYYKINLNVVDLQNCSHLK